MIVFSKVLSHFSLPVIFFPEMLYSFFILNLKLVDMLMYAFIKPKTSVLIWPLRLLSWVCLLPDGGQQISHVSLSIKIKMLERVTSKAPFFVQHSTIFSIWYFRKLSTTITTLDIPQRSNSSPNYNTQGAH